MFFLLIAKFQSPFLRLLVHHLLVFPAVLVRHHQSQVFGMLLIVAEFLLSLPLLQIPLDDLETLKLFQVNTNRNLLAAYIQFNGFSSRTCCFCCMPSSMSLTFSMSLSFCSS